MKAYIAIAPQLILTASILPGCFADRTCDRTKELAKIRYLERAIEVGGGHSKSRGSLNL